MIINGVVGRVEVTPSSTGKYVTVIISTDWSEPLVLDLGVSEFSQWYEQFSKLSPGGCLEETFGNQTLVTHVLFYGGEYIFKFYHLSIMGISCFTFFTAEQARQIHAALQHFAVEIHQE